MEQIKKEPIIGSFFISLSIGVWVIPILCYLCGPLGLSTHGYRPCKGILAHFG